MRFKRNLLPLIAVGLLVTICAVADETTKTDIPPAQSGSQTAEQLLTIQRDISWLEQEIGDRKKDLVSARKEDSEDIAEDIADMELRLQRARLSFIATASEVELPAPEAKKGPKKRDLLEEAQQFIEPVFDAIHRVSEKPRRIEGYRTQIFNLRERLGQIDTALANLDRVIREKTYPAFEKQLQDSKQTLSHNRDEIQVQVDTFERKLNQELQDHRTIVQVVSEEMQGFVSSKGRNLLIAILVFAGVLWALLYLKRFVFRSALVQTRLRGINKPLQALYGGLAGFVSILAVLFTLHFLNDWFLVTVITLTLLGLAWGSKALITVFIHETKLALNLGPVKQGERVIWQGVPWLVKSLGFRSTLVNESLQGGLITLPASALSTMLSRSVVEGEPWFPTNRGDFVLLEDGIYGQVETQTPENVIINCGNARKHYATSTFLSKNPQNFSRGFEVSAEFVTRHTTVPPSLDKLRPMLTQAIATRLSLRLGKTQPDLCNFETIICASGTNSTKVLLKADCPGSLASHRDSLKRELQSAAGEAWREIVAASLPN